MEEDHQVVGEEEQEEEMDLADEYNNVVFQEDEINMNIGNLTGGVFEYITKEENEKKKTKT